MEIMKTAACVLLLVGGTAFADAPVENWVIPPEEVGDAARKAAGAIALTFEIPEDARKFQSREVAETQLRLYTKDREEFREARVVRSADVRPVSETIWEARRSTRLPLLNETADYVEVMYDVKSGACGWFYKQDLRYPEGSAMREPQIDWMDGRLQAFDYPRTWLLFPWAPGHVVSVYAGPSLLEKFVSVKIQGRDVEIGGRKLDFETLAVTGTANGFAELVHDRRELGAQHLGWVRLRDDAGRLLVWPGTGYE
jgi:hypothetical protein